MRDILYRPFGLASCALIFPWRGERVLCLSRREARLICSTVIRLKPSSFDFLLSSFSTSCLVMTLATLYRREMLMFGRWRELANIVKADWLWL